MTRKQVREFDSWAINQLGTPGVVLMENAGRSCAELVIQKLSGIEKPKVTIFCGTGNNGGDGYVIARHLFNNGFNVAVVLCGDKTKIKGDAKINLDIIIKLGLLVEELVLTKPIEDDIVKYCTGSHMLIDALFGTGLTGELRDDYKRLIHLINSRGIPILAVDIPSGLDCDTGCVLGEAIKAVCTITFAAVKKGFTASKEVLAYTGDIYKASIGVEPAVQPPNEPGRED